MWLGRQVKRQLGPESNKDEGEWTCWSHKGQRMGKLGGQEGAPDSEWTHVYNTSTTLVLSPMILLFIFFKESDPSVLAQLL